MEQIASYQKLRYKASSQMNFNIRNEKIEAIIEKWHIYYKSKRES